MKFSVIIPVYNRRDELKELLDSLAKQSVKNFEVIVVEDGSTIAAEDIANAAATDVKYFYKPNEGRSIARNYGMERATGNYFIFFDSDCVIPSDYFRNLELELTNNPVDCFGGPDAAHSSFSDLQKAINYSMTSFLTTGGIRGGKVSLEKFVPRTFNMGFSRAVYERVGGFREMFSEDIDMSMRIRQAGFSIGLIANPVWHKRRVNFRSFFRQVYVFGMSRITLHLLYPGSLKPVHSLPALFVVAMLAALILAIACSWLFILIPLSYFVAVMIGAFASTRNIKIAMLAVVAAAIQLGGYGIGFINAFVRKILFRQGRNINEEIAIRKGK